MAEIEMRYRTLELLFKQSIWAVITVFVGTLTILFISPQLKRMVDLGYSNFQFAQGQVILIFIIVIYYWIGLITWMTLYAYNHLIALEKDM